MSVLKPRDYKLITDELGEIYKKVRNSLFQDGDLVPSDSGRFNIDTIIGITTAADDTTYEGSREPGTGESVDPLSPNFDDYLEGGDVVAPPNSIGNDLDGVFFRSLNQNFTSSAARSRAASQISTEFRAINGHALNRTDGITTITAYYDAYGFTQTPSGDQAMFDDGMGGFDYFTADFIELSTELGTAIDAQGNPA